MNLTLNPDEGRNHESLLERIDFRDLSGPLYLNLESIDFVRPPTLGLLYGICCLHAYFESAHERKCSNPEKVHRYMERMNFFDSCPELKQMKRNDFQPHGSFGRFVPIRQIYNMESTDAVAEEMVGLIFSQATIGGKEQLKYVLTELIDNALQHSQSQIGCVIQAQLYENKYVEGVILDGGMGIRRHMMGNIVAREKINSDLDAINIALQPYESGTHNRPTMYRTYYNEGLGLSVSSELMRLSDGYLEVISGQGGVHIDSRGKRTLKIAGWPGTLLSFRINCQNLANMADIIEAFDLVRMKGHNLAVPPIKFIE